MSQISLYFRVALLAVPLALSTAGSAPAQNARRPIQLDDWYGLKDVEGLAVSPDGRAAAFTVSDIDRAKDRRTSSLWRVAVAGGQPDLGRWQGIFLFEHRAHAHERRITLHLLGE